MKYCLLCGTEYVDHVVTCAEDGEPLVDQETFESLRTEPLSGPLRILRKLEGPFHAHVVEDVLKTEGIPFVIRSNVDTAYSKIFLPSQGWGIALVLDKDLERADELVRSVMEAKMANGGLNSTDEETV